MKNVWIDVGAHLGESTLPHAKTHPDTMVYAFEPNIYAAQKIGIGMLPNYKVIPAAVSDYNGMAILTVTKYEQSSSILPFNEEGKRNWKGNEGLEEMDLLPVPVVRLDTFIQTMGIKEVDFLKIDSQGCDKLVLESLGLWIHKVNLVKVEAQIVGKMVYEGAPTERDLVQFMVAKGFRVEHRQLQTDRREVNLTFRRI